MKLELEKEFRYAAFHGDCNKIKSIRAFGVNIDTPDENGVTPLMLAAKQNKIEAVRLLLAFGANPSKKDKALLNPLMYAIKNGANTTALYLVDKTLKIDDWDFNGKTALIYATIQNMPEIVRKLLSKGANPQFTDNLNRTPIMYALKHGRDKIFDILEPCSDYPVKAMQMFYPKGCYMMGHAAILLTYKSGISRQYDFHDSRMLDKYRIAAKEVLGINTKSVLYRISLNKEQSQILRNRVINGNFSKAIGFWDVDKFTRCIGYKNLSPKEGLSMAWKGEDMAIYSGEYNFYARNQGHNCVTSGQQILDSGGKRFSRKITPGGVYVDGLKLKALFPNSVFTDSIASPFGIFREQKININFNL